MIKKIIGFLIAAIVLVAIIVFLVSRFLGGAGGGDGMGIGTGVQISDSQESRKSDEGQKNDSADKIKDSEDKAEKDNKEDEIPDNIIVEINEDKVTINGYPVSNAEELKDKVNEYNNDTRSFELVETRSILSTYEWVTDAFDDLEIYLKED